MEQRGITKIGFFLLWLELLMLPGCKIGCGGSSGPEGSPFQAHFSLAGNLSDNSIYLNEIKSERGILTLGINAREIKDINAVYFDLVYDPAVLNYSTSEEGDFFRSGEKNTSGFQVALENETEGRIYAGINRLNNTEIKGSGMIGKITFIPVAEGSTFVTFDNNKLFKYKSSTYESAEVKADWFGGTVLSERI